MTSFNLTREPWIPVEGLDGAVVELSTRDVLKHAHTLRALADSSPLVVAALTRHLLAVLHRSYDGPGTMTAWCAIASSGAFDGSRIDAYLDQVEGRMDLFHPTHPFAQTRGLRQRFSSYATPIDEIEAVRTGWGNARELFRHRPESPRPTMTAARAARALLAHHAFATMGTAARKPGEPVSASAAPLASSGVVILRGRTLFATLVANLLVYDPARDKPIATGGIADACSWEQQPLPDRVGPDREPKRRPLGYLDLLTWLSRRVELLEESGTVTDFINAVGQGLAEGSPRDPMVAYRRHDRFGFIPVGIDMDRAFWRNTAALFEMARRDDAPFIRPSAIDLVSDSAAIAILGTDAMYDVEVIGIDTTQTRINGLRLERVPVQARSFNDADARSAVEEALGDSDKLVGILRHSLFLYGRSVLNPGGRDADPGVVRGLVDSFGALPAAWSALGVAFEEFLRGLGEDPDAAMEAFRARAIDVVKVVFRSATARPETTGRWLQARAVADRALYAKLAAFKGSQVPELV
jgi:CRISPR system Cascade subunit CasA